MVQPVRRALIILLGVAAIIAVALLIFQDPYTLRLRSAVPAEDPAYLAYVAALVGAEVTEGNHYDVLTDGEQIFPAMLEAIDGAQRRISFETYIYRRGGVADRFTAAFERAARRGVRVTMVLDALGSNTMERSHVERLRAAGCKVLRYNIPRWYAPEDVNFRTHRKILVVDGEVGFTGGIGIDDHWVGDDEDLIQWRETHVRIRGPIVRLLEGAFYENLIETEGPVTPELDDAPDPLEVDGASLLVRSSPSGAVNDMKRLYLLILAGARRTLDIVSPYFITDGSTMWSLEDAVARGVRIRILVEGDITDAMPIKYASRAAYDQLMALGIEIYEYQPTMMHAKVMVVDGIVSMFGSANFDNRALELHDELNVAVWSRDLAARFTKDLERDLRSATKLDLNTWRRRPLLDKARERFWASFGEVF